MPRYIDAEKIKYTEYINGDVTVSKDLVEKIPTADVQEIRHGSWKFDRFGNAWCSVCHHCGSNDAEVSDYCPNCGAKMGGAEK